MSSDLKVYHSNNLEYLASLVSYIIKEHPLDNPFDCEQVIVQSNGMSDWLNARIADELGISMQIKYSFPWAFVWQMLTDLGYNEKSNPQQRFKMENMVWTIYSLLPDLISDDADRPVDCFRAIYDYVYFDDPAQSSGRKILDHVKLFQFSQSIAKVFDGYMLYRTKWLKNRNDDGTPKQPCRYLENFSLYDVKSVQTQILDDKITDTDALNQLWGGISPERWKNLSEKHRLLILNNMWQVVLWEKILEKNESDHHIANMIDQLIADLKTDSDKRAKLPQRIFVFGISSLPTKFLELLKALGQYIDVCYMFLNPCCQYWGDISKTLYDSITGIHAETFAEKLMRKVKTFPNFSAPEGSRTLLGREELEKSFASDGTISGGNSLLLSWGRQGRDNLYQLLDAGTDDTEVFEDPWNDSEPSTHTMLNAIKSDIFNLSEIDPYECLFNQDLFHRKSRLYVYDQKNEEGNYKIAHNLEIHSAYTRLREVECVYDALLTRFDRDPDLKPSDCIVMVPNINSYVPFIRAVFEPLLDQNTAGERRKRAIPYLISDQTYESESPFLECVTEMLHLYVKHLTPSLVMEFLNIDQIQKRYNISTGEWEQINDWIAKVNARVDFNDADFQLNNQPGENIEIYNSWYRSFRRMVTGSMIANSDTFLDNIQPYTAIEGSDTYLLGRFISFVDDLEALRKSLLEIQQSSEGGKTAAQWKEFVTRDLLERFFVVNDDIASDVETLERFIEDLISKFDNIDPDYRIDVSVFENYLSSSISETKQYKQFMSGKVNFCTFLPMRSIPFRHIFLLGMNDGEFPKKEVELGFDLMKNGYQFRGDRSDREDGRYMFLETLLSAKDSLYISYIGRSVQDKTELNPSVIVSELENYLTRTFVTEETYGNIRNILNKLKSLKGEDRSGKQQCLTELYQEYKNNAGRLLKKIVIQDSIASRSLRNFRKNAEHDFFYQSYQSEWFSFKTGQEPEHTGIELEIIDENQGSDPEIPNLTLSLRNLSDFMLDPTAEMFRRRFNVKDSFEWETDDRFEPFDIDETAEARIRYAKFKELKKLICDHVGYDELESIRNFDAQKEDLLSLKDICALVWDRITSHHEEIKHWDQAYYRDVVYSGRAPVGVRGESDAQAQARSWGMFLPDITTLFDYQSRPEFIRLKFRIPESALPEVYRSSGRYSNGYLVSVEGTIDDLYVNKSNEMLYLKSNYTGRYPLRFLSRAYIDTLCLTAGGTGFNYEILDYSYSNNTKKRRQYSMLYEGDRQLANTMLQSLTAEYIRGMHEYMPDVINTKPDNSNSLSANHNNNEKPISDYLIAILKDEAERMNGGNSGSKAKSKAKDCPPLFNLLFTLLPDPVSKNCSLRCSIAAVQHMLEQHPDYHDFASLKRYLENAGTAAADADFINRLLDLFVLYNPADYPQKRTAERFRDCSCFNFGHVFSYLFNCRLYCECLLTA